MTPVESLVDLLVKAEDSLRQKRNVPPSRSPQRLKPWVDFFFNAIGHGVGQLLFLLPAPLRRRAHLWMCVQMEQHAPEAFADQARYQKEAVERARDLQRRTGHWPAVLFLTSHPNTMGSLAWLRFELLRQALWIANALEEASPACHFRSHPQCFLAIDPFALDSVSLPVRALYSGLMHSQYLVWDRQQSTQSWAQKKWLLAGTGHERIAWRLLRALRRNPILMVITGGVPQNARLFYAVREWASTLKDARRLLSKHAIRLRAMTILSTEVKGRLPMETGLILPETEEALRHFLAELGYAPSDQAALLSTLAADFKTDIPLRLRLWKMLYARLARRGIPLLVLPLAHAIEPPHVRLGPYFEMTQDTDLPSFVKDFNAFFTAR